MFPTKQFLRLGGTALLAASLLQCIDGRSSPNQPMDMTETTDLSASAPDLATPPPTITAVSPPAAANNVATPLTITGTHFRAGATVTVGGKPCMRPYVTATAITCTVAARPMTCGPQAVVVTNPSAPQTAISSSGFLLLSPTFSFAAANPATVAVGSSPRELVAGDFNNDGLMDIVTLNAGDITVSLLFGKNDGTFLPAKSLTVGPTRSIDVADVNGDKNLDIVTTGSMVDRIFIFFGDGTGFFPSSRIYHSLVPFPGTVRMVDMNGDKRIDAVIMSSSSGEVVAIPGNGDGTFTSATRNAQAGTRNTGMTVADFNSDGKPDVVVTDLNASAAYILLGNGDMTFQDGKLAAALGAWPVGVVAGDVNNDGKIDFVATNRTDNTISLVLGNGDGSFQPALNSATGQSPISVWLGDLNQDSKLDVLVANLSSNRISYHLGIGGAAFAAPSYMALSTGAAPVAAIAADLNSDKQLDVIAVNTGQMSISTFLRQCQ